jgi:glycosyltransferase involved in cell wall biosynthesis
MLTTPAAIPDSCRERLESPTHMSSRKADVTDVRTVRILGTHGVPANYGGFETAAENVGIFLRDKGWRVVVYCQVPRSGATWSDSWNGLERVNIPVAREGWLGTSLFDLKSIWHASKFRDVCLTFGYNTAVFNVLQRVKRIPNVINMDGIEWSRARWGKVKQTILWANERIACFVGNDLIADHPVIEEYLATRARRSKLITITYGANAVSAAPTSLVTARGLRPGDYLTLICRPIPENSILELVQGFSAQHRDHKLVVLGNYTPDRDEYHRAVIEAASDEVVFLGGIYEPSELAAIRFHASGYLHGHTVGGTNPSLVEAMAAGNAVIAHDNPYNRWVVDRGAIYFTTAEDAAAAVTRLLSEPDLRARLGAASAARHAEEFTWERIGSQYEDLLTRYVDPRLLAPSAPDNKNGTK